MIITQPLEITTPDGRGTGRWRLVEMSDEHDGAEPLCNCGGLASDNPTTCGHESPEAARECPIAAAKVAHLQPARPTVAELARASGLFGLLAVLVLGAAGCPKLPPVSGCAPLSQRCEGDRPQVCSPTQRWHTVGDERCDATPGQSCQVRAGVAGCAR